MKEAPNPATRSAGQGRIRSLESAIGPKLLVKTHEVGERSRPKTTPKAKFTEVIIGPRTIFTTEKPRYTTKVSLNKEAMRPKSQFNLPRKEDGQSISLKQTPKKEKVQYLNRQQFLSTSQTEQKQLAEKNETSIKQKTEEEKKHRPMTEARKKAKKRRKHRKRIESYAKKASKQTEALLPTQTARKETGEMSHRTTEAVTTTIKTERPQVNSQMIVKKAAADIRQIEATYNALKRLAKSGTIPSQTYEKVRESILIQVEQTAKTVQTLKEPKNTKKPEPVEIPDNIIKEMQLKDLITSLTTTPKPLLKQAVAFLFQSISFEQINSIKQKLIETGHADIVQELDRAVPRNIDDSGIPPIDPNSEEKVKKDEKSEPRIQEERTDKKTNYERKKRLDGFRIKTIIPRMMWFIQNQESVNQRRKKVMLEKYKQKKQESSEYVVGKDIKPPVPSPAEISSQINPRNDGSIIAIASILKSYGRIESEQEAEHLANRMITIFPAGEISSRPTDRILTNQEISIIRNREGIPQAA